MNATMNNLTATATTSKKFAFTYNHITKKIVGTDVAFAKAGIPGSALEKELLARMEGQPTYTFEVIETVKKPAKKTYPAYKSGHLNISELSRVCDLSRTTIYKYISLLEA